MRVAPPPAITSLAFVFSVCSGIDRFRDISVGDRQGELLAMADQKQNHAVVALPEGTTGSLLVSGSDLVLRLHRFRRTYFDSASEEIVP
ncbi:MAG: hypothetical protein ACTHPD_07570 [Rhizomicrobium sp.]